MGCTMGLIRWLMFLFNFICCLVGIGLIGLGSISHYKAFPVIKELNLDYGHVLSWGMIVVGCIVFTIAFFGCCGAVRESHCMVITFSLCLLTIVVIQVAAGIFVYLNKDNLENISAKLDDTFKKIFSGYSTDPGFRNIVNSLQTNLDCCGVDSFKEWNNKAPKSCCPKDKQSGDTCSNSDAYPTGCKIQFEKFVKKMSMVVGIVAIVLAIIEIGGIIAGLCLANSIRNEERRAYRV